MKNFIFVVRRTDNIDYDEYDSFVVVAADEDSARHTHPCARNGIVWNTRLEMWQRKGGHEDGHEGATYHGWADAVATLTVTCVGVAAEDVSGVINSSFNAG